MALAHVPALAAQVVAQLTPAGTGLLVDLTVGVGGHAAALLEAAPGLRLLGLDRDPCALRLAQQRLDRYRTRVRLVEREFAELPELLAELGEEPPAAILADLGCSSLQLDSPERGFSFANDGPLDMRMGRSGPTAADLVNGLGGEELTALLWRLGEERRARAIVRAVVARRQRVPIATTGELARLVVEVLGPGRRGRVHPATRTFMALRLAVNDELGQLERLLEPALTGLRPGGRMAVVSFHSLEDRIVKHTFRRLESRCTCPPELPRCACQQRPLIRVVTRRALRPDPAEVEANPRSRSARMRVAERLAEGR